MFLTFTLSTAGDQDRILVGTDRGEVLVVVNGDVRGSLLISPSTVIGAIVASPKVCPGKIKQSCIVIKMHEIDTLL